MSTEDRSSPVRTLNTDDAHPASKPSRTDAGRPRQTAAYSSMRTVMSDLS